MARAQVSSRPREQLGGCALPRRTGTTRLVPPGGDPTEGSDRYLLAITFLRVVGAAHFPLQSRQRSARLVNVDLELPRSWRKFPDMPGLWELCERSLSLVNATDRPTPGQWAAQLEQLLGVLSSEPLAAAGARSAGGSPGRASRTRRDADTARKSDGRTCCDRP